MRGQRAKGRNRHSAVIPRPSSSPRRRGPITTGIYDYMQALQRLLQVEGKRRMGPRLRGDDGRELPVLTRRPEHVSRALVVGVAARDEQEVGEPVDVFQRRRR